MTLSDYRPISILPTLSKAMEIIVRRQITCYVERNGMVSQSQCGVRANHSISSTLLRSTNDLLIASEEKYVSVLLLLEFSGVVQGSVLGPLLFTLFINDSVNQISFCSYHLYANDVQLFISCRPAGFPDCIARLNEYLSRIHLWTVANQLSINSSKSQAYTKSKC
jgi:hypothetical protein